MLWFDAIGAAVGRYGEAFVLVIDDVHVIDDPEAAAILDAIAVHLPADSTLVLSGRVHRIDDSIARFRLDPGFVEIDASALALNSDESRARRAGLLTDTGPEAQR